jgi:hypothetical protein
MRVRSFEDHARCGSDPVISGGGRAVVSDAAHCLAAESAQADFAVFQRRIHSLQRADGTVPNQIRNWHHFPIMPPIQPRTPSTP